MNEKKEEHVQELIKLVAMVIVLILLILVPPYSQQKNLTNFNQTCQKYNLTFQSEARYEPILNCQDQKGIITRVAK